MHAKHQYLSPSPPPSCSASSPAATPAAPKDAQGACTSIPAPRKKIREDKMGGNRTSCGTDDSSTLCTHTPLADAQRVFTFESTRALDSARTMIPGTSPASCLSSAAWPTEDARMGRHKGGGRTGGRGDATASYAYRDPPREASIRSARPPYDGTCLRSWFLVTLPAPRPGGASSAPRHERANPPQPDTHHPPPLRARPSFPSTTTAPTPTPASCACIPIVQRPRTAGVFDPQPRHRAIRAPFPPPRSLPAHRVLAGAHCSSFKLCLGVGALTLARLVAPALRATHLPSEKTPVLRIPLPETRVSPTPARSTSPSRAPPRF
ncbi:hypothetical protein B0H11DRAFT_2250559 [Mycena galericulata]|nr:hypothetical protein B0H11DRAFT_2250559 [Mycena galericulata]